MRGDGRGMALKRSLTIADGSRSDRAIIAADSDLLLAVVEYSNSRPDIGLVGCAFPTCSTLHQSYASNIENNKATKRLCFGATACSSSITCKTSSKISSSTVVVERHRFMFTASEGRFVGMADASPRWKPIPQLQPWGTVIGSRIEACERGR